MNSPVLSVAAVMAHPDDAEFLAGGTLFHLRAAGCRLGIITMTAGDCGSATRSRGEISRIRLGEAAAAADFLGARYRCARLRDIEVFANADNVRTTVEILREFSPDVVLTHSPVDYMVDHEETSRLARAATFAVAMPLYETSTARRARPARATPALYYTDAVEGRDAFGHRILPQFYVDITGQIDNKQAMLARHASQREWLRAHHGVDEYIRRMCAWAENYGAECGCRYAEGLRQHLGHGYPGRPILQEVLSSFLRSPIAAGGAERPS